MKSNLKQSVQNQCAEKKLTFKDKFKNFIFKPFKSQKSKNTNLKISLLTLVGISSIGCFAFHWLCGLLYILSLFCAVIILLSPVQSEQEKSSSTRNKFVKAGEKYDKKQNL